MAYPTVSAPYGFQPINRQDGMAYAGATTQYGISSVTTTIKNGDLVYVSAGVIVKSGVTNNAVSTANLTAGVFMGCQYVNTQGQTVQAQYYPGNAAASSAIAYVVVDPNAAYKVAVTASGSATITGTTIGALGVNLAVRQGTGSTTTGDSGLSVVAPSSAGNASSLPVKVIGVVPATASNATNYTEVIVVLTNPQMTAAAGSVNFA